MAAEARPPRADTGDGRITLYADSAAPDPLAEPTLAAISWPADDTGSLPGSSGGRTVWVSGHRATVQAVGGDIWVSWPTWTGSPDGGRMAVVGRGLREAGVIAAARNAIGGDQPRIKRSGRPGNLRPVGTVRTSAESLAWAGARGYLFPTATGVSQTWTGATARLDVTVTRGGPPADLFIRWSSGGRTVQFAGYSATVVDGQADAGSRARIWTDRGRTIAVHTDGVTPAQLDEIIADLRANR
ncbi:hypothetical protein [Dactylosporangium sp. CS-033363]|uniref:hypothetical protein n=1 Tax=Dactylosporangium sp. CS-033363 TaxID=3239935 RepID=UPI003D8B350C